jgi:phosphate-selective porin OprO/OprP
MCAPFVGAEDSSPPSPAMPDPETLPALVIPPKQTPTYEPVGGLAPIAENFRLRGRLEADGIAVGQSARNEAIYGQLSNVAGFRRARLGATGTVGEQISWIVEFDFASGNPSPKDNFIAIEDLPIGRLRVGYFREPFTLEGLTSSNHFTFDERSPANVMNPARNMGVEINSFTENERTTWAVGAFRSIFQSARQDNVGGTDAAVTGRVTGLVWVSESDPSERFTHIGASYSIRTPQNNTVSYNAGPQSSLLSFADNPLTPFTSSVVVPANMQQLFNLEWAAEYGPWSAQAEWIATAIEQIGGGPVFLHGSYLFGSVFLTGEHRGYLAQQGFFGPIHVRRPFVCLSKSGVHERGLGAIELSGRITYLDFQSSNLPLGSNGLPQGDRTTTATLGLTWYLNDFTRVIFNWTHSVPVNPTFGPSYGDVYDIRTAIYW